MSDQDKPEALPSALADTPLGRILDERKKLGVDPVIHAVVTDVRARLEAAGARETQITTVTDTLLGFWHPTDSQLRHVAQELGIDVARLRHLAGGEAPHLWEISHPHSDLYGKDDELIENLGSFQEPATGWTPASTGKAPTGA